jgi:predicted ATP-grasp superfamily ATP-dependent carboligase
MSELVDPAEQLIAAAGVTGFSAVEFRRDAEGRPRLMEINPRLIASMELAVRAGVDFPVLLYRWARGDALKGISDYRIGVRMRWLSGDLAWLKETLLNQGRPDSTPAARAVATFVGDFFRPLFYDYLTLSDLRPGTAAAAGFISSATTRLRARDR